MQNLKKREPKKQSKAFYKAIELFSLYLAINKKRRGSYFYFYVIFLYIYEFKVFKKHLFF